MGLRRSSWAWVCGGLLGHGSEEVFLFMGLRSSWSWF